MKTLPYALFFLFCTSCVNVSQEEKKEETQLFNISILLDLSDRIDPLRSPSNPSHVAKDLEIIKEIVAIFKSTKDEMNAQKASKIKGKLKIYFYPTPQNSQINLIAQKLDVDFSKQMSSQTKIDILDSLEIIFENNLSQIYSQTIQSQSWQGSDIWRFFRDNVKNYCVESNYRNILVVLTDGYIYHKNSVGQVGNKYQYLTASNIAKYRNTSNPLTRIDSDGFGLIAPRNDLQDLEVLVLEVSPTQNNPNDDDILNHCIKKWLTEMGVKKSEVYSTDLPNNVRKSIQRFFQ